MAEVRECLLCKGVAKEEDALILHEHAAQNNGIPLYICHDCTQDVKKALAGMDSETLADMDSEEEDEYDQYYNREICGCGYESGRNRCYGQKCRKYEDHEHANHCTGYKKCEDCFGSCDSSDGDGA